MAIIDTTLRKAVATALTKAAWHAIDVWHEAALRRDAKQLVRSIASEAEAASQRIRV